MVTMSIESIEEQHRSYSSRTECVMMERRGAPLKRRKGYICTSKKV
jgi:hypothetical protein